MFKIAIIGAKNSGKTSLIEKLLSKLSSQGLLVMSVKHTAHYHKFDINGKDSDRHRQAGSGLTIAINPEEFAIYSDNNPKLLTELENSISKLFDLCIVEGDKFSEIQKILLTRNIEEINMDNIKGIIATYGDNNSNITNNHFFTNDIQQLSDYILKQISEKQQVGGHFD